MASVFAPWMEGLKLQQQSVLALALRGPDGDPKHTAFKNLLRPYRATVLKAAKYNRMLEWGEDADSFMSLGLFAHFGEWKAQVHRYLEDEADAAVLHHYTHFMHGAEILGYKHPDVRFRSHWSYCYVCMADRLHLVIESEEEMDKRLSDWDSKHFTN